MPVRIAALALLLAAGAACGGHDPEQPAARPEPRGVVVDLDVNAATMREMAEALTRQTGVRFALAPGVRPDAPMRDPYQVFLPRQDLAEHLRDLTRWGFWRFEWRGDHYRISVTDAAVYR